MSKRWAENDQSISFWKEASELVTSSRGYLFTHFLCIVLTSLMSYSVTVLKLPFICGRSRVTGVWVVVWEKVVLVSSGTPFPADFKHCSCWSYILEALVERGACNIKQIEKKMEGVFYIVRAGYRSTIRAYPCSVGGPAQTSPFTFTLPTELYSAGVFFCGSLSRALVIHHPARVRPRNPFHQPFHQAQLVRQVE